MTIEELKRLRESEDKVEFKEAKNQFSYKSERNSVLAYVVALANEGGGKLVFGMKDKLPHEVVGSAAFVGSIGQLEQDIFTDLKIRVHIEELYDADGKRVMVTNIPSRPIGRLLYFEDVPLMRVGDALTRMSEDKFLSILQENEPDFSARTCDGLTIDDLNPAAIKILKEKYSRKQSNSIFESLSDEQALKDLSLITSTGAVTYAALILTGKKNKIEEKLPQAKTIIEYRATEAQISSDWREEIEDPLFIGIDKIWDTINKRNSKTPVQEGAYIFDVISFNEEVIREAVLNAITHRDYTYNSEIVVKQFPKKIVITNPGGFPKGVTLENILTINSTPRSRLMADVLLKTGLVERSGQGVDKIFSITLSEGKPEPDYSASDLYQVCLVLQGDVVFKPFHIFISQVQSQRSKDNKLGVEDIITLAKIRDGIATGLKSEILNKLERENLIQKVGGSHSLKYTLGKTYQAITNGPLAFYNYTLDEITTVQFAADNKKIKIGNFIKAFGEKRTRDQVKFLVHKLVQDGVLEKEGRGAGTLYSLNKRFTTEQDKTRTILKYLMDKYQDIIVGIKRT